MNYEEKQSIKLERYQELSQKAQIKSENDFNQSNKITENIPFGQPILVGHHSEKRHRAVLKRSNNLMRKSIEEQEKGEYYNKKAENILNPSFISSDDDKAIIKIKEKITKLEKLLIRTKDLNSKLRKFKTYKNAVVEVNKLSDDNPNKKMFLGMLSQSKYYAMPPDRINAYYFNTISSTAEIKRLNERIKKIEKVKNMPDVEETINNITIKTDKEENRIKLFFPDIPKEETRNKLKRNGFRWSPFNRCWQRQISEYALFLAKDIIKEVV